MKQELREKNKAKLDSMPFDEVKKKSALVIENLKKLDEYKLSKVICIYVSTEKEVHTHVLIRNCLKEKTVLVPYMDSGIKLAKIESFEDLEEGSYGILEPKEKKEYEGEVDLILVPGISFDNEGNRLGRGKGFYDMFLANTKTLKAGLAFEDQILNQIPKESHDIPMDMLITEVQAWSC